MLLNAYFLAKFRFDAAENEPAKKIAKFAKSDNFANFASPNNDHEEVVGKTITIRAAGGLKLKVTAEVYDATRLIQGHWRKFWRKKPMFALTLSY